MAIEDIRLGVYCSVHGGTDKSQDEIQAFERTSDGVGWYMFDCNDHIALTEASTGLLKISGIHVVTIDDSTMKETVLHEISPDDFANYAIEMYESLQ